ncbi:hypothetical protein MJO28_000855 [Puccinia striiformis f. sp. tritici]|uniref:Uncharacterized protein n=1 Tax=Puccinia striiformis f. sp. tritici TaxID=168172 RepID=A0ACC0EZP6_9BASI|nr:hypothetical protein MJO28_000855 [Puccinia striiformis f. sp. tritici]
MAWHYSNRIEFEFEYSNRFDSMCYALPHSESHLRSRTELSLAFNVAIRSFELAVNNPSST